MTDTVIDSLAEAKRGMRLVRNAAISATDYAVLPDSSLNAAALADMKAYRQYLRDLPDKLADTDFLTFKGVPTLAEWKASLPATPSS